MSDLPKIVYFGSDAICLPGLKYLVEQAGTYCRLAAVISQPDRRQGRGKKLQQNPVAAYASAQGIPLHQPEKPDSALASWLRNEQIVLAFVMAYGHFLPKAVRQAPRHGMLNFHASCLPAYRGASPVETAVAQGEASTGVCLMQIVREMDAGAVAACETVSIEKTDSGPQVRSKVGQAVIPLLEDHLSAALRGMLGFTSQDTHQATYCRKISKADGALDFTQSADAIDARLRAFTPWPGGYFDHGTTRIKVGQCSIVDAVAPAPPGRVMAVGESVDVATGEGVLRIWQLQRPGGRMLNAADFLRGYPLQVDEVLPSVRSAPLLV